MSRAAAPPRVRSFVTASRTHVGLSRSLNEDRFLARPEIGLWAVADGMGGHQAGDLASLRVVEALVGLGRPRSGYAYLNAVRERLIAANADLVEHAAKLSPGAVIGSTVVVLLAHEDHYACVWAGDSRVYLRRGGALMRVTHDHSLMQELIDSGALEEQEARTRRISNVITRAVGATGTLELSETHGDIRPGDVFLLCSDGLTGLVEDHELGAFLALDDLEAAADRLLALTLKRGAKDNVTLMLVRAQR
ncbi:protein phosphatase 2C domain-containing protein [Phenylobacterium sp. LH3H17]|uniref:PP2C family protein-serine/threonine phosphatase n=1 Tax=Phenylobacterium sp. LH3H17 TaxID=2903901 RepID=UPI0020C9AC06|nr:protein phosphatase 2C domain-containing protein [Phenylobacterium sp. LH3H17]UTP37846.1 protein phosphatase 2C domain-containing protein [Phenylobacterium sp. LH3H17]